MWPRVINPAVFSDPQLIPQLVPPRGPGRPTLYSPELIEEFCGLIADGMTIDRACKEAGMPSKRTICNWLKKYPDFRREFEGAVTFRNQWVMDECIDIADEPDVVKMRPDGTYTVSDTTNERRLRCDARWKQLGGMRLKAVGKERPKEADGFVIENDPIHAMLHQWEIEYQRKQHAKANGQQANVNGK